MKKAKIMLMVIAIFGVVGGALAFKASKFITGTYWICLTTTSTTTQLYCTAPGITTTNNGAPITNKVYFKTSTTGTCPHVVGAVTKYCTSSTTAQGFFNIGE